MEIIVLLKKPFFIKPVFGKPTSEKWNIFKRRAEKDIEKNRKYFENKFFGS
jgi:hypothetical protein